MLWQDSRLGVCIHGWTASKSVRQTASPEKQSMTCMEERTADGSPLSLAQVITLVACAELPDGNRGYKHQRTCMRALDIASHIPPQAVFKRCEVDDRYEGKRHSGKSDKLQAMNRNPGDDSRRIGNFSSLRCNQSVPQTKIVA